MKCMGGTGKIIRSFGFKEVSCLLMQIFFFPNRSYRKKKKYNNKDVLALEVNIWLLTS